MGSVTVMSTLTRKQGVAADELSGHIREMKKKLVANNFNIDSRLMARLDNMLRAKAQMQGHN